VFDSLFFPLDCALNRRPFTRRGVQIQRRTLRREAAGYTHMKGDGMSAPDALMDVWEDQTSEYANIRARALRRSRGTVFRLRRTGLADGHEFEALWLVRVDCERHLNTRGKHEPLLVELRPEFEDVSQGGPFQFSFEFGTRHALLDDPRINLTASPPDRDSARTGEAVKEDQRQAGVGGLEVELNVLILHDETTPTFHVVRVFVLRLAEGVLDRAAIVAQRDGSETPATKEVSQGYDRHVGSRRTRTHVWDYARGRLNELGCIRASRSVARIVIRRLGRQDGGYAGACDRAALCADPWAPIRPRATRCHRHSATAAA
jgi:hypothetical protein